MGKFRDKSPAMESQLEALKPQKWRKVKTRMRCLLELSQSAEHKLRPGEFGDSFNEESNVESATDEERLNTAFYLTIKGRSTRSMWRPTRCFTSARRSASSVASWPMLNDVARSADEAERLPRNVLPTTHHS